MTKSQIIDRILTPGIVAVIRVDSAAALLPICEALLAGGVTGLEITMTSPDAIPAIAEPANVSAKGRWSASGRSWTRKTCRAGDSRRGTVRG